MSKYHFTPLKKPAEGQCLAGSLTGEVDSYNATESYKGWLVTEGNRDDSAMTQASLTARPTSRAGAKAGHSDPPNG
jgi:hypothetical protein